jgi:DNA-binding HxlR family transcriptional regulator
MRKFLQPDIPGSDFSGQNGPVSRKSGQDLHDASWLAISFLMRRKSFTDDRCPVARTLDRVGDPWSILILRDAGFGKTRFDEFEESLGIAPNMLSRRLASLVEAGMLERRPYSEKPERFEYVLTPQGRDFQPVLSALKAFGDRHYPRRPYSRTRARV